MKREMERDSLSTIPHSLFTGPQNERSEYRDFFFRQRAIVDWNYGLCGDCYAIGVQHRGDSSGYKLPTLFGSDCDDGVSAV